MDPDEVERERESLHVSTRSLLKRTLDVWGKGKVLSFNNPTVVGLVVVTVQLHPLWLS